MLSIVPHKPLPSLIPFIELYYVGKVGAGISLPSCNLTSIGYTSVILQFGKKPLRLRNFGKPWVEVSKAIAVGQYYKFLEVSIPDDFEMIGIRIRPSVFHSVLGVDMRELTHSLIPAEDLLGSDINQLVDRLRNESDTTKRLMLVDLYFLGKFKDRKNDTRLVDMAIHCLRHHRGNIRIDKLSEEVGYSPRFLQKKFLAVAGIPPKYLGRIIQFNSVLSMLKKSDRRSWTDVAFDNGYYDQSHLINAFIEFTGSSPIEYNNQVNDVNRFYIDSYD